ncbi:MAG: hypothetical protein KGP28_03685 [Bdellovibrionales bacterium]|nr:hypothetical protein [Bdellovibrionales bacterium]
MTDYANLKTASENHKNSAQTNLENAKKLGRKEYNKELENRNDNIAQLKQLNSEKNGLINKENHNGANQNQEAINQNQEAIKKTQEAIKKTQEEIEASNKKLGLNDQNLNEQSYRSRIKGEKKTLKEHEKNLANLAGAKAIQEKHEGSFDGAFGTLSSTYTQGINHVMTGAAGVAEQVSASRVQAKGAQETANIAAQGLFTDNKAVQEAENRVRDDAKKALKNKEIRAYGLATIQAMMGVKHLQSNQRVTTLKEAAEKDLRDLEKRISGTNDPAQKAALTDDYNRRLDNVGINTTSTKNAQGENALKMAVAMKDSLLSAWGARTERNAIEKMEYAGKNFNSNYNIQLPNEAPLPGVPDSAPTVTALDSGQVLNSDSDESPLALDDQPQFNLNDPNAGPEAPAPGGFGDAQAQAPQGAAGGAAGGVGGTAAAQDDGSPEAPAKTKDPVVSYASNDASAPRGFASKSGGDSAGVGVDQAFADLLKKLLPGEEEGEKKDAGAEQVALGDRAPATDQAAVIGRNQNIFEVIHKRYLKKNQEGAVLYNL